jgi:hypothetical protein
MVQGRTLFLGEAKLAEIASIRIFWLFASSPQSVSSAPYVATPPAAISRIGLDHSE